MRSSIILSLAASAALAVPVLAVSPSVAEAAPNAPALVEHFHKADKPAPSTTTRDAQRYAQAEQNAPDASKFSGGAAVLIIGPTLLVILVILLLVL